MKAKRLLSAFVAVAMMVTIFVSFSTVTFAGTYKPTVAVNFVKMTAEELNAFATSSGCTPADGSEAYWLIGTMDDYGTLDCGEDNSVGRRLVNINVILDFENDVKDYFEYSSKFNVKLWKGDQGEIGSAYMAPHTEDVTMLSIDYAAASANIYDIAYPNALNTSKTGTLTWVKLPVYVKATTPIVANVEFSNVEFKTYDWGEITAQEKYTHSDETLTLNTTVTVGEAADDDEEEVVNPTFDTTVGDTDGVAITGSEKKFDNAFAVSTSIVPGSATEVGMLFIPKDVADKSDANWAKATYTGEVAGKGIVEFTAAIKNIPRALEGTDFVMISKAYAKIGDVVSYGAEKETTINFGSTGEVE